VTVSRRGKSNLPHSALTARCEPFPSSHCDAILDLLTKLWRRRALRRRKLMSTVQLMMMKVSHISYEMCLEYYPTNSCLQPQANGRKGPV